MKRRNFIMPTQARLMKRRNNIIFNTEKVDADYSRASTRCINVSHVVGYE
jgi:hypothetical protein